MSRSWLGKCIGAFAIVVNLAVSIMNTYDELRDKYGAVFLTLEVITVAFFLIDYVLRILIAKCKYPEEKEWSAIRKYVFSFVGIVDLLSFLPVLFLQVLWICIPA